MPTLISAWVLINLLLLLKISVDGTFVIYQKKIPGGYQSALQGLYYTFNLIIQSSLSYAYGPFPYLGMNFILSLYYVRVIVIKFSHELYRSNFLIYSNSVGPRLGFQKKVRMLKLTNNYLGDDE